jgi:hypothetical protein
MTLRASLKEAIDKGACVLIGGTLNGSMKDIKIGVNDFFEDKFWESSSEPRGVSALFSLIDSGLQIFRFTKKDFNRDRDNKGEGSLTENCKSGCVT